MRLRKLVIAAGIMGPVAFWLRFVCKILCLETALLTVLMLVEFCVLFKTLPLFFLECIKFFCEKNLIVYIFYHMEKKRGGVSKAQCVLHL
jgi:hypothetical protein